METKIKTVNYLFNYNKLVPKTENKPRRIPLNRLRLEDENTIPTRPDVIIEKPNDKQFEKEIKTLKDKIEDLNKKQKDLKTNIEKQRSANNPEFEKLKKKKTELLELIEPLFKELTEKRLIVKGPLDEMKHLKALRSSLTAQLDFTDLEAFQTEIRSIQKKLGFGSLSSTEEKKLIEKKNRLEDQKTKVEKLTNAKNRIKILHDTHSVSLNRVSELSSKLKTLYDKKNEVFEDIRLQNEHKNTVNDPLIKQMKSERDEMDGEFDLLNQKIYELTTEWETKWYHYEQQQKELDYINEATKIISLLKKKIEKDAKRKEKEEKKKIKILRMNMKI